MSNLTRILLFAAIFALAAALKITAPVTLAEDPIPQCSTYPACPPDTVATVAFAQPSAAR